MTGVDLAEEDAKFMRYLLENGWDGEIGEDDDKTYIVDALAREDSIEDEKK